MEEMNIYPASPIQTVSLDSNTVGNRKILSIEELQLINEGNRFIVTSFLMPNEISR